MSSIGTYGSSIYPPTPYNVLPEPGDALTYDWQDAISQFSQRYMKMATVIATVVSDGTYFFDYSALRNDLHPPFLCAYFYEDSKWKRWVDYDYNAANSIGVNITYGSRYIEFVNIGIGTSQFHPFTGTTQAWLLTAYL